MRCDESVPSWPMMDLWPSLSLAHSSRLSIAPAVCCSLWLGECAHGQSGRRNESLGLPGDLEWLVCNWNRIGTPDRLSPKEWGTVVLLSQFRKLVLWFFQALQIIGSDYGKWSYFGWPPLFSLTLLSLLSYLLCSSLHDRLELRMILWLNP